MQARGIDVKCFSSGGLPHDYPMRLPPQAVGWGGAYGLLIKRTRVDIVHEVLHLRGSIGQIVVHAFYLGVEIHAPVFVFVFFALVFCHRHRHPLRRQSATLGAVRRVRRLVYLGALIGVVLLFVLRQHLPDRHQEAIPSIFHFEHLMPWALE
ncbi:hypothetical protein EDB84DRAFT_1474245 [Lactarius hengduanensis]|nr:hypothetical protein EDB84DRAFT_1474245 [Lactarius hengduanensis]